MNWWVKTVITSALVGTLMTLLLTITIPTFVVTLKGEHSFLAVLNSFGLWEQIGDCISGAFLALWDCYALFLVIKTK